MRHRLKHRPWISIHAPRTGSDTAAALTADASGFQFTLPARGATRGRIFKLYPRKISIHAPRTGSDVVHTAQVWVIEHFNSRSPHGERRFYSLAKAHLLNFNSRSPHGERRMDMPGFLKIRA